MASAEAFVLLCSGQESRYAHTRTHTHAHTHTYARSRLLSLSSFCSCLWSKEEGGENNLASLWCPFVRPLWQCACVPSLRCSRLCLFSSSLERRGTERWREKLNGSRMQRRARCCFLSRVRLCSTAVCVCACVCGCVCPVFYRGVLCVKRRDGERRKRERENRGRPAFHSIVPSLPHPPPSPSPSPSLSPLSSLYRQRSTSLHSCLSCWKNGNIRSFAPSSPAPHLSHLRCPLASLQCTCRPRPRRRPRGRQSIAQPPSSKGAPLAQPRLVHGRGL